MESEKNRRSILFALRFASIMVFAYAGFILYKHDIEFVKGIFSNFGTSLIAIIAAAAVVGLTFAYLKGLSREIESRIKK